MFKGRAPLTKTVVKNKGFEGDPKSGERRGEKWNDQGLMGPKKKEGGRSPIGRMRDLQTRGVGYKKHNREGRKRKV